MDSLLHNQKSRESAPSTTDLHPLSYTTQNIFVGRARELTELRTMLESMLAGRGQLVLLAGEPGIGKTRLTDEFAVVARQQGVQVFWGRCWEGDGAPSFWPWVQIVRAYLQVCDVATLPADLRSSVAAIAQVVPEIREHVPDLPVLSELSPDHVRFRFFDSLTSFLKKTAAQQPFLLVLDDLHWADTSSLLLLQFLARALRDMHVLVIGTYRDTDIDRGHPLSGALGTLARESQQIALSGLGTAESGQFIEGATGVAASAALVTAVHQQTEGNPFFISELVRLLEADGYFTQLDEKSAPAIAVPQGVRDTIRRRLVRMSSASRQILAVASVIGREFDLELLVRTCQSYAPLEYPVLLASLQETLTARLIGEGSAQKRQYRFTHALIRETLYHDVPLPDRVQLHRHVGEAIEQCYAAYLQPHLAELADHFFKAASDGTHKKALQYALQAGERANALLAYEEAALHYERALQLIPTTASAALQRCEVVLALGDAQARAGEAKKARTTFLQAADMARPLVQGDHQQAAVILLTQAALGVAGHGDVATRFDKTMVNLLEEALAVLPEENSALRVRVLSRLAMSLYFSPFVERRHMLSQQAVAMARRLESSATLAYALSARHMALIGPDTVTERLALADEVIRLAEAEGKQQLAAAGHFWRMMDVLELGEIAEVDREIRIYAQLAEELRQPFYFWQTTVLRAMRALLEGRFAEAEQLSQEGFTLGQQAQTPNAFLLFAVQLFSLRREQGRLQELENPLKALIERFPAIPSLATGLAFIYSELGKEEDTRREFERFVHNDFADLPRDQGWFTSMAGLSFVTHYLCDTQWAAILYDYLRPYATRNIVAGSATDCYGSVSRYLGLLAATLARWEEAERHFQDALAMNTRIGARPWIAHTQHEYARMLVTRNDNGDREHASELLAQALATAHELGMPRLEEKVKLLVASQTETRDWRLETSPSVPSAQPLTPNPQPSAPNVFRREGDYWTVGYASLAVRLRDAKGMHHILCLLREPGREFHVMDLLAMTDQLPSTSLRTEQRRHLVSQRLPISQLPDSRSFPDRQAKAAYQRRLEELRDEMEEAERFNDPTRIGKARAEIDFITMELATAYGVGQHARARSEEVEKARKTIANRIRTVLTKIQRVHPVLWRHLSTTLKTGTFCSYTPEKPMNWDL